MPLVGDWNGGGQTKVGYFYQGKWVLDYDGNGIYTAADKNYQTFPYVATIFRFMGTGAETGRHCCPKQA